jgi:hypothetical protein
VKFADRNILDLLEFPSAIMLERGILDVARKNQPCDTIEARWRERV